MRKQQYIIERAYEGPFSAKVEQKTFFSLIAAPPQADVSGDIGNYSSTSSCLLSPYLHSIHLRTSLGNTNFGFNRHTVALIHPPLAWVSFKLVQPVSHESKIDKLCLQNRAKRERKWVAYSWLTSGALAFSPAPPATPS